MSPTISTRARFGWRPRRESLSAPDELDGIFSQRIFRPDGARGSSTALARLTLVPGAYCMLARDARLTLGFHGRASREHGASVERTFLPLDRSLRARPKRSWRTPSDQACLRPILGPKRGV